MRAILLAITLLFFFNCLSQDQEGYYITGSGQKTAVFFKTTNFYNSEKVEFRDSANGAYTSLPSNVTEYGIGEEFKFKKYTVKIDKSQSGLRSLSTVKDPEWERKSLFLNVLVEGNASLYSYKDQNEDKFFYSVVSKSEEPVQLIYKKYRLENAIKENNAFRQELYNSVRCSANNGANIEKAVYTKNGLARIFQDYNTCNNYDQKIYTGNGSSEFKIKFTVFAGVNVSSLKLDDATGDKKASLGFGGEVAFIMPSNKLSGFFRLEFESINNTVSATADYTESIIERYTVDAQCINAIIGPRYNITKNLFVDAGLGINAGFGTVDKKGYSSSGNQEYLLREQTFDLGASIFLNFAVGYSITDNFGIDIRYDTNKNLLTQGTEIRSGKMALNARYTFN